MLRSNYQLGLKTQLVLFMDLIKIGKFCGTFCGRVSLNIAIGDYAKCNARNNLTFFERRFFLKKFVKIPQPAIDRQTRKSESRSILWGLIFLISAGAMLYQGICNKRKMIDAPLPDRAKQAQTLTEHQLFKNVIAGQKFYNASQSDYQRIRENMKPAAVKKNADAPKGTGCVW